MGEEEKYSPKERKTRIRYYEEGKEDLRYRGPLSYRAFKILGWLCIACSQVVVLMTLNIKMDPGSAEFLNTPQSILTSVGSMSVPLLLMANFALILNATEGYHRQLIRYGLTLTLVAGLAIWIYCRYVVGAAEVLLGDRTLAFTMLEQGLVENLPSHFLAFNLFIDLFLCSLLMFFLHFRPKRAIQGKKIILFRMLSVIPILYETCSVVLKILAVEQKITLPILASPFLTVKPPMMFLTFIVMALFLKHRERKFLRNGRTYEEYQEFLQTNRNSLHFSTFSAILFAIAGVLDILAGLVLFVIFRIRHPEWSVDLSVRNLSVLGIGKSSVLLFMAPLMLLFSYTRKHKNRFMDTLIPIGGLILIAIVYLEGAFMFLKSLPIIIQNILPK